MALTVMGFSFPRRTRQSAALVIEIKLNNIQLNAIRVVQDSRVLQEAKVSKRRKEFWGSLECLRYKLKYNFNETRVADENPDYTWPLESRRRDFRGIQAGFLRSDTTEDKIGMTSAQ